MLLPEFIKEVVSFVNSRIPGANWNMAKDFALLHLDDTDKTILFLSDQAKASLAVTAYTNVITEALWNKNTEASKSRLCSMLGLTRRIHGRQCLIRKITKTDAKTFVDSNHIMGYASAHFNYGIYLKNDLVAVACFSKGRRMNRLPAHKKSFELIRFCNKNYFTVVGGLSKLIRFFELLHHPGDIMTYVDGSWGQPHAYYALGFLLDKVSGNTSEIIFAGNNNTFQGNYKLIKHLV